MFVATEKCGWDSKAGVCATQSAGQWVEIVRLPAGHDVDGSARRTVCDRCESVNVPVEQPP